MNWQTINTGDPETALGLFSNVAGDVIPINAVVCLDISTDADGIRATKPAAANLDCVLGLANEAVASVSGTKFWVQTYGYRAASVVLATNTSRAAGVKLVPVDSQWYLLYAAAADGRDGHFAQVESYTTSDATVSLKVFIRCC